MPPGYGAAATGVPALAGEPVADHVAVGEGDASGRDARVGTAVGVEETGEVGEVGEVGEPAGVGALLAAVALRLARRDRGRGQAVSRAYGRPWSVAR